jgi:parvulin-like peptidyl-prolyl isomerase
MKKLNSIRWKRICLTLLLTALSAVLFACGQGGAADGPAVAATVNGADITEDELNAFTELMIIAQGYDLDEITDEGLKDQIRANFLDAMIETEVVKQYFDGKDVLPDDIDVQAEDFIKGTYAQSDEIKTRFEAKGITDDVMKLFFMMPYYRQALEDEETRDGELPVEADMLEYYEQHRQEYLDGEQRRVSHILVGDSEHKPEDLARAEEIREAIVSGQASFEDMAKENSLDGSAEDGGDLGVAARSAYVAEFSDAAFSLPVDEISEVVESMYGFHIIKVTEIQEQTFDVVRESIRQQLAYELYDKRAKELVAEADIAYTDPRYPSPEDREAAAEAEADASDASDASDADAAEADGAEE